MTTEKHIQSIPNRKAWELYFPETGATHYVMELQNGLLVSCISRSPTPVIGVTRDKLRENITDETKSAKLVPIIRTPYNPQHSYKPSEYTDITFCDNTVYFLEFTTSHAPLYIHQLPNDALVSMSAPVEYDDQSSIRCNGITYETLNDYMSQSHITVQELNIDSSPFGITDIHQWHGKSHESITDNTSLSHGESRNHFSENT